MQGGHAEALEYLRSLSEEQLDHTGVHMAQLPKVGVNPGSLYNTPMGIYFYPASYYIEVKQQGRYLEFADPSPYIHIIEYRSSRVLDVYNLDGESFDEQIDRINSDHVVKFLMDSLGIDDPNRVRWIIRDVSDREWDVLGEIPLDKSFGGILWFLMYYLTKLAVQSKRSAKGSVFWNKLIRKLGYDVAVDHGAGIIHENERDQGVIVNPRAITGIKTIKLTYTDPSKYDRMTPMGSMDSYQRTIVMSNAIDHAIETKTRNRKLESLIVKFPPKHDIGMDRYVAMFLPSGWPAYEATLSQVTDPNLLITYVKYCAALQRRLPELEAKLLQLASPMNTSWLPLATYRKQVMHDDWPEYEAKMAAMTYK